MQHTTDIVIIGAGHAGVEAVLAASRLGLSTVLFTLATPMRSQKFRMDSGV